jgi:SAM-dependent methyltransferase
MRQEYNKISEKKHWDSIYTDLRGYKFKISLDDYWKTKFFSLLSKYLPIDQSKKFIEIGGAPGVSAILFNKIFKYNSYALDYSEIGIKESVENFKKFGIVKENALLGDFLNKNFLLQYQSYFDVVFSDGFIEHFKNPADILDLHLYVLKKDGYLIIRIPVNNFVLRLQPIFGKNIVSQYDGSFMNMKKFSKIFVDNKNIEIKYLNYMGGINLSTLVYKNILVRKFMHGLQRFMEIIGLEKMIPLNRFTSPYLICIARKI